MGGGCYKGITMNDDTQLLRRYADEGFEAAFAEVVRRHVDLVYGAALRQTHGNAALAQDVVQGVFTDMARKAAASAGARGTRCTARRAPPMTRWTL